MKTSSSKVRAAATSFLDFNAAGRLLGVDVVGATELLRAGILAAANP